VSEVELGLILLGWGIALASPGPATIAIAGTAMAEGRRVALLFAAGVATGSAVWGVLAAIGLGALILSQVWAIEVLRYLGACYLLWLALKSLRSAMRPGSATRQAAAMRNWRAVYLKGLMLHLTNPKAVLFWGALFSVIVSPAAPMRDILVVGLSCMMLSLCIFFGYAVLFSSGRAMTGYLRLRRWFDGVFAVFFGMAGLKILTVRLT
jgi:RhtB (resistance to homoserine/threonine) family protein